MPANVSVTIITLNEEKNLVRCLDSLRWCDEVVVCDSFSTDRTKEIATSYENVTFFEEKWHGYGAQKNIAATRAKNNWIFNVDADEVCSPELSEAIRGIVSGDVAHNAFRAIRRNHFCGKRVHFCGLGSEEIIRLYRKDQTRFSETKVHEGILAESTGLLEGDLFHYSFVTKNDFIERHKKYADLAAQDMQAKGRKCGVSDLYLRPLFTFFKVYVLKLGLLDGAIGFFLAKEYARYTYLKYWNLQKLKK